MSPQARWQAGRCSVIVPTHNRRDRLLKTLATIRAQTYADLEIVVSDDGSTDGTAEAVRALDDDRIVLARSPEATGVARARNRAVEASTGEFLAVCDDDDLWVPKKIEGQIEALRRTSAGWCYCFVALVDEDLVPISEARTVPDENFMRSLSSQNPIPGGCSSVLCRRDDYDRAGGFDPAFSMFADWDLWVRLAAGGPPAVWPSVGTVYVVHSDQMSRDMSGVAIELQEFRAKHAEHRQRHGRLDVEPIDGWIAARLFESGDYLKAARLLLRRPSRKERIRGVRLLAGSTLRMVGFDRAKSLITSDGIAAVGLVRDTLRPPAKGSTMSTYQRQ